MPEIRTPLRIFGEIFVTTFLIVAVFSSISLIAAALPSSRIAAAAENAARTDVLARHFTWPFGKHDPVHIYTFNDCLILDMLLVPQRDSLAERAVSPPLPLRPLYLTPHTDIPRGPECQQMLGIMLQTQQHNPIPTFLYNRYLHGDWVVSKLLLFALPFTVATVLLFTALIAALAALAFFAFRNAVRPDRVIRRDLCYALLAVFIGLFWAIPAWDFSLSFAPADILTILGLSWLYCHPISEMPQNHFIRVCAVLGCMAAIFDFLTGVIPTAMIVLLIVLAFETWTDLKTPIRMAFLGIGSFCAAIILSFAFKQIVVCYLFGPQELLDFFKELQMRAGTTAWTFAHSDTAPLLRKFGLTADAIRSSRLLSTGYAFVKMVYFTRSIGWGSLIAGVTLAIGIPLAFTINRLARWRRIEISKKAEAMLLWAAFAVVWIWCGVFVEHTITAAFFMFRMLSWPFAGMAAVGIARYLVRSPKEGRDLSQLPAI